MNIARNMLKSTVNWFSPSQVKTSQDIDDSNALNLLQPLIKGYLPWTSSAMRPSAIALILNDIVVNDRKVIVELGGGITTILISNLLSSIDSECKLITIEHDEKWISVLQSHLSILGAPDYVDIVHAGLQTCTKSIKCNTWYDFDAIMKSMASRKIDTLIVDGPPAYLRGMELSRYPALPLLFDSLSENFSVFIDDGNRSGELHISKLWDKEYELEFSLAPGNLLVATRGKSWNIS